MEANTLQIEYDEKRHQYVMENKITHQAFYNWLASAIGIVPSDVPASLAEIKASADPYFNDIRLQKWDAMDRIVRSKAVRAGMRSWSLSDTVCVLKCYARRYAVTDLLTIKAVNSGDGFRQWVYPNLPENYDLNPEITSEIECAKTDTTVQDLAEMIYKAHA